MGDLNINILQNTELTNSEFKCHNKFLEKLQKKEDLALLLNQLYSIKNANIAISNHSDVSQKCYYVLMVTKYDLILLEKTPEKYILSLNLVYLNLFTLQYQICDLPLFCHLI